MESSSEMEGINEVLNIDFEGRPADDTDIIGIQILLKQLLLQSGIDISEIANQVVSQNYIGNVLHQIYDDDDDDDDMDDDDPVFGIITVINVTDKKDVNFIKQLQSFVTKRCSENCSKEIVAKFEKIMLDPNEKIGFLINERILASPQVALPNFESLWNDLKEANRKKMNYDFSKYLIIARASITGKKKSSNANRLFVNPEDDIFFENASITFDFSVKGQQDCPVEMSSAGLMPEEREPIRTVMIIEADKIPQIMETIKSELCE